MKQKFQALQRETIEGAGTKGETLEVTRGDTFEADSEHGGIVQLLKVGTIQVLEIPPASVTKKSGGEQ